MDLAEGDGDPIVLIDRAAAILRDGGPEASQAADEPDAADQPDEFTSLIRALHRRTDRGAFDAALAAACSPDLPRRIVGVHVLGQIGYLADRPYQCEALAALLTESGRADDDELVAATVSALGYVADPLARPGILRHVDHPDPEVRRCVAAALPACAVAEIPGPDAGPRPETAPGLKADTYPDADADIVHALIALTRDPAAAVRDWATFGLGSQLRTDSPAVRAALADRLDDPDGDIAGEALLGLACRRDPRASARVLRRLEDDPGNLIIEAAEELADPACLPALLRLRERLGLNTQSAEARALDAAIAACTPPADHSKSPR